MSIRCRANVSGFFFRATNQIQSSASAFAFASASAAASAASASSASVFQTHVSKTFVPTSMIASGKLESREKKYNKILSFQTNSMLLLFIIKGLLSSHFHQASIIIVE
jgi:hypothetical protein